jgi:CRISPR type III-B/RAMP module-associated protein Cmr5
MMAATLQRVMKRQGDSEDLREAYARTAKKLPTLIQVSGLAQAIAFTVSKASDNEPARAMLLADLAHVLQVPVPQGQSPLQAARAFQDQVSKVSDVQEYIRLTRRAQQGLQFFKRFSESVLGIPPEGTDEV